MFGSNTVEKGQYLTAILRSPKTVFSFKDIILLWGNPDSNATRVRIHYYVKNKSLIHLRRGIYAKNTDYDRIELATKIFTPSYVSFETVLRQAGLIFQYSSQIFLASYLTREISVDGQTYLFKKIKDTLLTQKTGVQNQAERSIATAERAFLDTLYCHQDYHFDNLSPLNWDLVFAMLPLYANHRVTQKANEWHQHFKETR